MAVLCLDGAPIDHRGLAFFVLDDEAANDLARGCAAMTACVCALPEARLAESDMGSENPVLDRPRVARVGVVRPTV